MNWGRRPAPRRLTAGCAALILGLLAVGSPSQADDSTVRDFVPRGAEVSGLGTPSGAPTIDPGLYHDTLGPAGDPEGVKYYLVRHVPKSIMYVSATARPPKYGDEDNDDGLTLTIRTQSWEECASWPYLREADYGMRGLAISDVSIGLEDDNGEPDPCAGQSRVVLEVRRGDPSNETPNATKPLGFELQIVEEPQVQRAESLPPPDETDLVTDQSVPPQSPTEQVNGGTGFADAATLEAGTSRDTIRPGEVRFYRIRAGWGTKLATSVRLQPDSSLQDDIDENEGLESTLRMYNPTRAEIEDSDPETYYATEPLAFHATLPEVRYRNRESDDNWQVSMAGYYYLALELERDDGAFEVPVEISVALTGKPSGHPTYVGLGTPSPVPESSGTKLAGLDRPISIGIASVGGVLVLIGVVLGALFLRRSA